MEDRKYEKQLEDGREVVIGEKADGTKYLQMDDNYIGTYNFITPLESSPGHTKLDLIPYLLRRNTPD